MPPLPLENREGHCDGQLPSCSILWITEMRRLSTPDQQRRAMYTPLVVLCSRFVALLSRIISIDTCYVKQILSGKVPYHYYSRDIQIVAAIFKGETPTRPDNPHVTDHRWEFIQRCWVSIKNVVLRPSGEEIVAFSTDELLQVASSHAREHYEIIQSISMHNVW